MGRLGFAPTQWGSTPVSRARERLRRSASATRCRAWRSPSIARVINRGPPPRARDTPDRRSRRGGPPGQRGDGPDRAQAGLLVEETDHVVTVVFQPRVAVRRRGARPRPHCVLLARVREFLSTPQVARRSVHHVANPSFVLKLDTLPAGGWSPPPPRAPSLLGDRLIRSAQVRRPRTTWKRSLLSSKPIAR